MILSLNKIDFPSFREKVKEYYAGHGYTGRQLIASVDSIVSNNNHSNSE